MNFDKILTSNIFLQLGQWLKFYSSLIQFCTLLSRTRSTVPNFKILNMTLLGLMEPGKYGKNVDLYGKNADFFEKFLG